MSAAGHPVSPASFTSLIGFWRWTPRTRVFFADAAVCRLFGIDPAIGRSGEVSRRFVDSIHRDDRDMVSRRIGEHAAAGLDFAERYRTIDAQRQVRDVLSVGHRLDTGSSGEVFYIGAIFGRDDLPVQASPSFEATIEHLMAAKGLADSLQETMLARLIEAVLLEAGRSYARALRDDMS